MAQQFTNNARALTTASITDSATTIVVEAAKADLFPVANVGTGSLPSASNWFKVTLQDSSGNVEIVAVRTRTAGSGLLSNVIRGYDGTTARAFTSGTVVGIRITAEDVQTALDLPNQNNVFTGDNTFSGINEFTDTVTVPNAAYGNSSATAANTAFVQAALQAVYPVGSIYINSGVTTNPATLLGFGTWTAFGAGRVMVGLNGSDALFDALEETGGSKDAVVVSHTHTGSTNTTGAHVHNIGSFISDGANSTAWPKLTSRDGDTQSTTSAGDHSHTFTTGATGSSGTNANLQPYITVAMWKRTA
jgi:hypothetical protein